jgi:hypothetical protein
MLKIVTPNFRCSTIDTSLVKTDGGRSVQSLFRLQPTQPCMCQSLDRAFFLKKKGFSVVKKLRTTYVL